MHFAVTRTTRPLTSGVFVCTVGAGRWSRQSYRSLSGGYNGSSWTNAKARPANDTLSRGLQGFAFGVTLTALGFYVLQQNIINLDGQNIGAIRPQNTSKVTTKQSSDIPDPTRSPQYASPDEVQQAIKELHEALPRKNAVVTDPNTLRSYGHSDNSYHPTSPHSVVVRPQSTEDVVKIVNIARKYKIPIVPYSGATSLEGHFSGYPSGDICLDMSGMDKILEIHESDGDLICQSGARWEDINSTLKEKGIPLFFPLDPGPGATIGGMIGTGCSGTNAVRYGTARSEWFLNVTVVLPNGKVVKTRRRARKSSTGFDTTKLFIGAEGTLGIVTEATLRLAPVIPNKVAVSQFPDVEHAVNAVQEILNTPYGPHIQCVELLDDHMMDAINNAGLVSQTYPVKDTLFFKIQGDAPAVQSATHAVEAIISRHGGTGFKFAETDEEAEVLWESRKYALMSTIGSEEGARCWTTDVCVPVSKLPELVYETMKDLDLHHHTHDRLRLLEVGALKPDNYASSSSWIDVTPIDLRSQHPSIMEQDFLLMDLIEHSKRWDAISLSLVVNFVPNPKDRGKMLSMAHSFLKSEGLLFLVLPLPCILNSRYMTPDYLLGLMSVIGFDVLKSRWKDGGKIAYWLFRKSISRQHESRKDLSLYQKKRELRQGNRNNFTILL